MSTYLEPLHDRVIVTPVLRDCRIALPEDVVLHSRNGVWQVLSAGPSAGAVNPGDFVYVDLAKEKHVLSFTFDGQVVYCIPESLVAARLLDFERSNDE